MVEVLARLESRDQGERSDERPNCRFLPARENYKVIGYEYDVRTFPMMINKITSSVDFNYWLKRLIEH